MSLQDGVETSYLQMQVVPGTDGKIIAHITCYDCGKKGRYADNCPNNQVKNNEEQHVQFLDQQDNHVNNLDEGKEQMMQLEDMEQEIVNSSWTQ